MATNVRVKVSDGFASVTNGFTVTVTEVNVAPIFTAIAPKAVNELALLSVVLSAKDSDLPAQVLTYGLVSEPTNMTVSEVGTVVWTPTEAQGPSTNTVRVKVSDGAASVTNGLTVTVAEVNVAPKLVAVLDRTPQHRPLLAHLRQPIRGLPPEGSVPLGSLRSPSLHLTLRGEEQSESNLQKGSYTGLAAAVGEENHHRGHLVGQPQEIGSIRAGGL